MLYILDPVFIIVLGSMNQQILGLTFMFILIAVATGLLVYRSSLRPGYRYEKVDDSMVEEFKQWHVENKQKKEKENAYVGAIWPIIVAVYFSISFTTGAWRITWVIFIIGAAIQQIIKAAPVSYTHLDVYKRQVWSTPIGVDEWVLCNAAL